MLLEWQNDSPRLLEKHSVDVYLSKPRILDEMEQKIRDTSDSVLLGLVMRRDEPVSLSLQKCMQTSGTCLEI